MRGGAEVEGRIDTRVAVGVVGEEGDAKPAV